MNLQFTPPSTRLRPGFRAALALGALILSLQSGCCCFECVDCFQHCAAPLSYFPPRSALCPRNPPCSFVDPTCYGYHATCWRSWPADCDAGRDCFEWCQQDALPVPVKGDAPPMLEPAPIPDRPDAPLPMPESPAPAAPPATDAPEQPAPQEPAEPPAQPADFSFPAPIVELDEVVTIPTASGEAGSSP